MQIATTSAILIFLTGCSTHSESLVLKGPYLGQTPPRAEPQLFMPGLVSTHGLDICIAFLKRGKVCVFSNDENKIYFTHEKDGRWTKPEKAPFPDEQGKTQYTAGPDDRTLYFQSTRPTNPNDKRRDCNTWAVEWTGSGWTEPYLLPEPANTEEYHEIYPSMTSKRTLYYFSGWRKDAPLGDSYRNRFVDGKYQEAEKLEYPINSEYHEIDPFVAPDESYLIFASNRPGGFGFMDLYICFQRDDGSWTHPINLGQKINSYQHVITVCVTLDHKYFFFSSSRPTGIPKGKKITSPLHDRIGDIDLYWVETGFIKDLRRIALSKKQAAPIIDREYQENGLQAVIKKLKELHSSEKDIYHFSLSELLIICGRMIKEGKVKDAEKFYETLLQKLPDKFRIKQGYATVNILNGLTSKGVHLLKELWTEYPSAKSDQALEPIYSHLNFTLKRNDELTLLRFITVEFPNSYIAFYDLAYAYERLGKIEMAIKNCKKSLELKPDFREAVDLLNKLEHQRRCY
jgi:tetratricopeptide (TPR) repeat protein